MSDDFDKELLISSLLVRIVCLENSLISKGIIDVEEYTKEISEMTTNLMRTILLQIKSKEETEQIIKDLQDKIAIDFKIDKN